jgi:serine-type D-Ala-D-Ala carboxypeptidase (penicillin-binding protein 5/6)
LIAGALLLEGSIAAPPLGLPNQLIPQVAVADIPVIPLADSAIPKEVITASISAQSFLVLDRASGAVLAERAAATPHYPASTVKLLTALVVLEAWAPTDTITLSQADINIGGEIQNPLAWQAEEVVSIHDLLASLLINSDNLTAAILANHYPGGAEAFMAAMGQLAGRLSLTQTYFMNPMGLDASAQKLSAEDLAILAKVALDQPILAELVQQKTYTVVDWRQGLVMKHLLTNTNQLLWSSWQVKGVKTGTTDLAGEVLVSLVTVEGHDLLLVVMGSQDRYLDTQRLLTEIRQRYRWQTWSEFAYNGAL